MNQKILNVRLCRFHFLKTRVIFHGVNGSAGMALSRAAAGLARAALLAGNDVPAAPCPGFVSSRDCRELKVAQVGPGRCLSPANCLENAFSAQPMARRCRFGRDGGEGRRRGVTSRFPSAVPGLRASGGGLRGHRALCPGHHWGCLEERSRVPAGSLLQPGQVQMYPGKGVFPCFPDCCRSWEAGSPPARAESSQAFLRFLLFFNFGWCFFFFVCF